MEVLQARKPLTSALRKFDVWQHDVAHKLISSWHAAVSKGDITTNTWYSD
jgi:hypothetical protein